MFTSTFQFDNLTGSPVHIVHIDGANEGSLSAISVGIAGIAFAATRYLPRLTHSPCFRLWRMTHWVTTRIVPHSGLSAAGKRPEFVSAKRAASPLQGRAATIERTEHWFESICAFGIVVSLSYATSIGALLAWSASYCLFRLTHSRRFCLRQITHWVITSFVPWFESSTKLRTLVGDSFTSTNDR